MSLDWKKLVKELLRVAVAWLAGATAGCAFVPVF